MGSAFMGAAFGTQHPNMFSSETEHQKTSPADGFLAKVQGICRLSFIIRLHDASSRAWEMVPFSTARTMMA